MCMEDPRNDTLYELIYIKHEKGKDLYREPRSLRVLKFKMTGNCYDMSYEIPRQYDVGSPFFSLLVFDIYKLIQSIIARVFHAHIGPSISIRES